MAIFTKIIGIIIMIGGAQVFVNSFKAGVTVGYILSVVLFSIGALTYAVGRRVRIDEKNHGNPRANEIYRKRGIENLVCPKCGEVYKSGMGGCPRCAYEKNIYHDEYDDYDE